MLTAIRKVVMKPNTCRQTQKNGFWVCRSLTLGRKSLGRLPVWQEGGGLTLWQSSELLTDATMRADTPPAFTAATMEAMKMSTVPTE